MGMVGGLASLAVRNRCGSGSVLFSEKKYSPRSSASSAIYLFFSTRVFSIIFPHRDERLRQHGVAAATSSPGRTERSAILGHFRIRSANQRSSTKQLVFAFGFFKLMVTRTSYYLP